MDRNMSSPIFEFIDRAINPDSFDVLLHHIKETPMSMYAFSDRGHSVYSHACFLGLNHLEALHRAFTIVKEAHPVFSVRPPYDHQDENTGDTAVIHCCVNDLHSQFEMLVAQIGCDVNIANNAGQTPLHLACEKQLNKMLDILLFVGGARVDVVNKKGLTPLFIAVQNDDFTKSKLLLSRGADAHKPLSVMYKNKFTVKATAYDKVLLHGTPEMQRLFEQDLFFKQKKKKTAEKTSHQNSKLHRMRAEHSRICRYVYDNNNIAMVRVLAAKLGIRSAGTMNKSKKELCDIIAQRMLLSNKHRHVF